MNIGLCAWSFSGAHGEAGRELNPFEPRGLAEMAGVWGLQSIEGSAGWFDSFDPDELAAFADYLASHSLGLFVDTGGDIGKDPEPLLASIRAAHALDAGAVRMTVSSLLEGDRSSFGAAGWQAYLASLVDPLKEAMAVAEDLGVPVGMENHQDICSWELCWLCEQVGSPALGVTMDCGNALAVGETPSAFAGRVMPFLKHVHLKDYAVHATPSGYRLRRCPLGDGVVDWPEMFELFAAGAPQVSACIELGSTTARHIRLLEDEYWETYPPRPLAEAIAAIRTLHRAARPPEEDWRTPHERGESADTRVNYELDQLEKSVRYLRTIGALIDRPS